MPESAKPTYSQTSWEEKLALMRQQMQDSLVGDAAITRQVKNLKRKDFTQQRNVKSAEVEYTADDVIEIRRGQRWSGIIPQAGAKRIGGGGGNPSSTQMKNPLRPDNLATRVTHTGTTTVLNPGETWTTEGWQPVASMTPDDRESLRVVNKNESLLANTGFGGGRTGSSVSTQAGRSMLGEKFKKRRGPAKGSGDPDKPLSVTVRPQMLEE